MRGEYCRYDIRGISFLSLFFGIFVGFFTFCYCLNSRLFNKKKVRVSGKLFQIFDKIVKGYLFIGDGATS